MASATIWKLLEINFSGDPTLISSTAFDGSARVDRYIVSGRSEEFASESREFLAYLVKVNSLSVVILVETHGQPEFVVSQQLFLGLDPRDGVQMITAVQIAVFRICSPIVHQTPGIKAREDHHRDFPQNRAMEFRPLIESFGRSGFIAVDSGR